MNYYSDKNCSDHAGQPEEVIHDDTLMRNASGHVQELDRSFSFLSIAALGILTDNAWSAGGGTLVVA